MKNEDLVKMAIGLVQEHQLVTMLDVINLLPIKRSSFYNKFPAGSAFHEQIAEALERNKIVTRADLRKRWAESDNPALQIALYKLIANKEELGRLGVNPVSANGDSKAITITWGERANNSPNDGGTDSGLEGTEEI